VGALVGAPARNIALAASATAAFIQAMSSFDFVAGDVIVTSRADYTSYQIQYLALAKRLGVRIVHAPDRADGGIDPDAVRDILRREPRTRLVHVSWIPTHSGLVQDVEAVGDVCEAAGTPYLVDACQAVGQMPIDVARLKCDYLSATARKFLRGPRGMGFLYASDRALTRGDHPLFVDMRGAKWTAPDRYTVSASARRYEDWEFPYALVLGLGEAARYASEVGADIAQERAWSLASLAREQLAAIDGVRVLDPGLTPCAIVTAQIPGWNSPELVAELRKRSINTSATLAWFGLLDFEGTGVSTAIRISPHYYNTADEVTLVTDAIAELRR
jgi:selenocysteine lyase/cysteine desulfurase